MKITHDQTRRLEEAINHVWQELSDVEDAALTLLQGSFAATRRDLAALRVLLAEIIELDPQPPDVPGPQPPDGPESGS